MKKSIAFLCLCLFAALSLQAQIPRLALVIGNAAYEGDAALKNPVNDAVDVSKALADLGWKVTTLLDADRRTMIKSANAFRDSLSMVKGSTALFFYAGHGMQLNGENYLIPIKAPMESEDDVRTESVPMSDINLSISDGGAGTNVIILDACRDNPFLKKTTRSGSRNRGLTVVSAAGGGGNALIFSTSPNDVAQDGEGKNGAFTEAFLKFLAVPDLKIEDMMKKVRQEVVAKTDGKQQPWSSFSLSEDFYFSDRDTDGPVEASVATPISADPTPRIEAKPAQEQSVVLKLQSLVDKKSEYQNILPQKIRQKRIFSGVGWGSLAVLAVGAGIGTYSYISADELKPQYDAATTEAEATAFRAQIERMNTLFKVGTIIGIGGATVGVSSLLIIPNTKSIEDSIRSLDDQIQTLQGEL